MGKRLPLISLSFAAALTSIAGCDDNPPSSGGSTTGSGDASGDPVPATTTTGSMTTGSSESPGTTSADSTASDSSEAGGSSGEEPPVIDLENLQDWTRVEGRILHDVVDGYGVAADIHVFRDEVGELAAVYSGTDPESPDFASIKLARGSEHAAWEVGPAILNSVGAPPGQRNRETSFYRRTADGTHEVYYIGYDDEETYRSQIFRAQSSDLEGPYAALRRRFRASRRARDPGRPRHPGDDLSLNRRT